MNAALTRRDTSLQLSLYSGIALIVLSMLFLGRQQASDSFLVQAITVLAAPAIFYGVGILISHYLRAPLAAPGIVATGAWLVGVGLIHLYDKRGLLPAELQPYYWLGASLFAGALITVTGHRVKIWLLAPLVPLAQINAMWATMSAFGLAVEWMPALSFGLVLIWWELPLKNERWTGIYHVSAVFLTLFLLVFSLWLPVPTARTLMTTWGAGALLIAVLGLRHGWARLGPLTIAMLVCASIWGLPAAGWPLAWLGLAAVTAILIERMTNSKDRKAVELSLALAVLLCGAAAFFAETAPLFFHIQAAAPIPVLISAGILLLWLGWRRDLRAATHAGLWLSASAWGTLYFVVAPTSGTYGLWLTLFAVGALLYGTTARFLPPGKAQSALHPLRNGRALAVRRSGDRFKRAGAAVDSAANQRDPGVGECGHAVADRRRVGGGRLALPSADSAAHRPVDRYHSFFAAADSGCPRHLDAAAAGRRVAAYSASLC